MIELQLRLQNVRRRARFSPPARSKRSAIAGAHVLACVAAFLLVVGPAQASTRFAWLPPTKIDPDGLSAVSCSSVSFCVAVDDAGRVIESTHPTGGYFAWKASKVDRQNPAVNPLPSGVSCPSSRLCVAVDALGQVLTSTHPAGGKSAWKLTDLKASAPQGTVQSVSCASPSMCAVTVGGTIYTSINPTGNAAAWRTSFVDSASEECGQPLGAEHCPALLSDISCPSRLLCVAFDTAGNEIWSTNSGGHTAWTASQVIDESTAPTSWSVSCPSRRSCVAVDSYDGHLVASTDPTGGPAAWTVRRSSDGLVWVTCATTTLCFAADPLGDISESSHPTGSASTWTPINIENDHRVTAIACPSARLCVAVDMDGNVLIGRVPPSRTQARLGRQMVPSGKGAPDRSASQAQRVHALV